MSYKVVMMCACVMWFVSTGCTPSGSPEEAAASATGASAEAPVAVRSTYEIGGMTCVSCANTIRTGVMELPGVELATVLFADERLVVDWAHGVAQDDAAVIAKVVELGYSASSN